MPKDGTLQNLGVIDKLGGIGLRLSQNIHNPFGLIPRAVHTGADKLVKPASELNDKCKVPSDPNCPNSFLEQVLEATPHNTVRETMEAMSRHVDGK